MLSVQAFRPFGLQPCALLACCNLAVSCSLHCFQLVDILLVYACLINFKARMPTSLCLVLHGQCCRLQWWFAEFRAALPSALMPACVDAAGGPR